MVNRGAKHFVLVSRSGGQNEKVQQLLDEVQGKAKVQVRKCDVADEEQVQSLVDDCSEIMPPICGVVNAVMALHVSSPLPYGLPEF
jgi:NAD(P)-dependent dehydrogenase (short-subunit alcohol dehydrogenase family)